MKHKPEPHITKSIEGEHASFFSYTMGFLISLALTISAYLFVSEKMFEGSVLIIALVVLGLSQAIVQLVCFFNLGKDKKDQDNLFVFLFMILVLLIVVIGSLWIMYHLNYRLMPSMDNMKLENQSV